MRKHAWSTSLLIVAAYFLVFAFPALNSGESFGRGTGMEDAASMVEQLPREILIVFSVLVALAILGWWRESGFVAVLPGGLKFAVAPLLFTLLILGAAIGIAGSNNTTIVEIIGVNQLLALLLMTLLVGVFEEILFRGILFHGASAKFGPVGIVVVTAIIFGIMHFVNYVTGQPMSPTVYQVLHAVSAGFMYGALRLRIGALWPIILVHGFWDASVAIMGSTTDAVIDSGTAMVEPSSITPGGIFMLFPALLYGLFVMWRWSKWKNSAPVA